MIINQQKSLFFSLFNIVFFVHFYASEDSQLTSSNPLTSCDQSYTVIALINNNESTNQLLIQDPRFDCSLESNTRFFANLLRIKMAKPLAYQNTNDPFLQLPWETINHIFSYLYTNSDILTQNYDIKHYLDKDSFTHKPISLFFNTYNMPDNSAISLNFFSAEKARDFLQSTQLLISQNPVINQGTCKNFLTILNAFAKNLDIFFHQFRAFPDVQKYLEIRNNAIVSEEDGKWLKGKKEKYNDLDDALFKGSVYVNTCYIDDKYIFLELYNNRQNEETASENISNFFNLFYGHVILICERSNADVDQSYVAIKTIWLSRWYDPNSLNHNTYKTSRIYNLTNIEKNSDGMYIVILHDTKADTCFEINPLFYKSKDIFIKSNQLPICNPIYWEKIIIAHIEQLSKKAYPFLLEQEKLMLKQQKLEKIEKNKQETKSAHFKILVFYAIIECLLYRKFGLKWWHTIAIPLCGLIHFICYDLAGLSRDIHAGYAQMNKE